jgi:hypothetical protein
MSEENTPDSPSENKPVLPSPEQLAARPHEKRRVENMPSLYANSTNMETSFVDFQLFFGDIIEASAERLVTEDKLRIIMSPQHAKAVLALMERQIKAYEDAFGVIPTF